jgi:hypothetical protein
MRAFFIFVWYYTGFAPFFFQEATFHPRRVECFPEQRGAFPDVGSELLPSSWMPRKPMERAMGIEPTALAWEARVLPLYDAREVPNCKGKIRT